MEKDTKHVAVSFGPEHSPMERRQVELAIKEAQKLIPRPDIRNSRIFSN
jgi:adenine-specific DNA-methyltransferase